MGSTLGQLREGIAFIRANRADQLVAASTSGIAASLVGVLGVLGPDVRHRRRSGLEPKDFVVVVLPLGFGIVTGILLLNSFGPPDPAPPDHRGRPGGARHLRGPDRGRRADLAVPPEGRARPRACIVAGRLHVAAGDRRVHRAAGRHRVRVRRHPGPDAAPGGPPRGRPRPRVRRPEHARVRRRASCRSSSSGRSRTSSGRPSCCYVVGDRHHRSRASCRSSGAGRSSPTEARATAIGPATPAGLDPVAVAMATEMEAGERRARRAAARRRGRAAAHAPRTRPPGRGRRTAHRRDARADAVPGRSTSGVIPRGRMSGAGPDLLVTGRIATLAGRDRAGLGRGDRHRGGRVVAAGTRADVEALAGAGYPAAAPRAGRGGDPRADRRPPPPRGGRAGAAPRGPRRARSRSATLIERVRAVAAARPDADAWIEGARLGRGPAWPLADRRRPRARGAGAPGRRSGPTTTTRSSSASAPWRRRGSTTTVGDPDGGVIRRDDDGRADRRAPRGRGAARRRRASRPRTTADVADALGPLVRRARRASASSPSTIPVGSPPAPGPRRADRAPTGRSPPPGACGCGCTPACARSSSTRPIGRGPAQRARRSGRTRWTASASAGSRRSRTGRSGRGPRPCWSRSSALPGEPPPPNDGYGVWLVPPDELRAQAARAAALGIATQIHGIGDAAVRAALDALAPHRRPHAAHAAGRARPAGVDATTSRGSPRSGIAASMQPIHVRSDAEKARRLWGPRAEARGLRARRRCDRTGAVIAFGTDAPVEPVDPWPGLACAVTRSAPDWPPGTPPFGPAERARPVAGGAGVRAWTRRSPPARADRGRLVAGQRADIVVLPAAARRRAGRGGRRPLARPAAAGADRRRGRRRAAEARRGPSGPSLSGAARAGDAPRTAAPPPRSTR